MKHALEMSSTTYVHEIRGALARTGPDKYAIAMFHNGVRVNTRFFAPFQIAYDSLTTVKPEVESAEAAGSAKADKEKAASAGGAAASADPAKPPQETKKIIRMSMWETSANSARVTVEGSLRRDW